MKEIKLNKLRLENFKSHRSLCINFDGRNATILGDNATGKTSVFDAFMWLLFSKDSLGNGDKSTEIKPLDSTGEVRDHSAVTEVEAVLLVNGEETALRRTYQEVWTTKRGAAEASYDGNVSEYYVDGVPCKKNAFDAKVQEIVQEETFRLLTSTSYFAKDLSWQKRREILFGIIGVAEDDLILSTDEQFAPLIEAKGRLALADFKAKLLSEKRGLVGARNEIPARINECQKTIDDLGALDFEAAKAELDILNARKESISGELVAIGRSTAADGKRVELQQAQLELEKLEEENRRHRESQKLGQPDVKGLLVQQAQLTRRETQAKDARAREQNYVLFTEKHIADARERWISVNGETFTGGCCPTCGQSLPAEQLKAARDTFEANRRRQLRDIEQSAERLKQEKAAAELRVKQCDEDICSLQDEIAVLNEQIEKAERCTVTVTDMEGYQEKAAGIREWIRQLQGELEKLSQDAYAAGAELRVDLGIVTAQVNEKMAIISKEAALQYAKGRICELREDAARGAEKLNEIEKYLFLMDEYSRYKTKFVEDSVNDCFRIARFRLFREQANGGVEDRCDVVYDGVPYIALNSGAKINVGVDIINTLSEAYGVMVPLFVDNAESVTQLEPSGTQVIRLVVSENDKELRVNYEN